jgi:phosphoribosylformimino-5-aminoimidazole carboxamide ribotide isomerase
MLIIPAIDLKNGCVVRLLKGDFSQEKVYSRNPVKVARYWVSQGAALIHLVDLDGAKTGVIKNLSLVKDIIKKIKIPVQFGGGLRSIAAVRKIINAEVYRVVLGTKAIEDEKFLEQALRIFKDKIIVSIDGRQNRVLVRGWQDTSSSLSILALARKLKKKGCKEIIYTDVAKDGTLKGPNIKMLKALLEATNLKIIASGGISNIADLIKLKALEKKGLIGAIVGKALYESKFSLSEALKLFPTKGES